MLPTAKFFLCLLLCVAPLVAAQSVVDVAPPPSLRFPASWYPPDNGVTSTTTETKGAPYTATLLTTGHYVNPSTQQVTTHTRRTFQARDSSGRKRDESPMVRPDGHGGTVDAREVSISDPVSHCSFRWMEPWVAPGPPTASVTCLPRTLRSTQQDMWARMIVTERKEQHQPNADVLLEPLGERDVNGVHAVGVRNTKTMTNPRSEKLVTELWVSPDIKEVIEMKQIPDPEHDLRSDIPYFELTEIRRVEPDPALFYPPAGYQIRSDR